MNANQFHNATATDMNNMVNDLFTAYTNPTLKDENQKLNIEKYMYRMEDEGLVFGSILSYLLDNIIVNPNEFQFTAKYLDFLPPIDKTLIIDLGQNFVRGICTHGGNLVQPTFDKNYDFFLLTNWNSEVLKGKRILSDPTEIVKLHSTLKDDESIIRIFAPKRLPSNVNENRFNGIFSKDLEWLLRLERLNTNFDTGNIESTRSHYLIEPTKEFLSTALKLIVRVSHDKKYEEFLQRRLAAEINIQAANANINSMLHGENINAGTSKEYEELLFKETNELYTKLRKDVQANLKSGMINYSSDKGLTVDEVNSSSSIFVPVGTHIKKHHALSTGFDSLQRQSIMYFNSILGRLNLNNDPSIIINSLRIDIENMLNILFTYYITPEFFRPLMEITIPEQIAQLKDVNEKFISKIPAIELLMKKKEKNPQIGEFEKYNFPLLNRIFNFDINSSIRDETVDEEIKRIETDYDVIMAFYEKKLETFHKNVKENGIMPVNHDKYSVIVINWGKSKVLPFNNSAKSLNLPSAENSARKKKKRNLAEENVEDFDKEESENEED